MVLQLLLFSCSSTFFWCFPFLLVDLLTPYEALFFFPSSFETQNIKPWVFALTLSPQKLFVSCLIILLTWFFRVNMLLKNDLLIQKSKFIQILKKLVHLDLILQLKVFMEMVLYLVFVVVIVLLFMIGIMPSLLLKLMELPVKRYVAKPSQRCSCGSFLPALPVL